MDISFHVFLNTVGKCSLDTHDLGSIWVPGTSNGSCTYETYSLEGKRDLKQKDTCSDTKSPLRQVLGRKDIECHDGIKWGNPIQSECHEGFPKEVTFKLISEE